MIKRIKIEDVDMIFKVCTKQSEIIYQIYNLAMPMSEVEEVKDHPTCSMELWQYICHKFIMFDRRNSPNMMTGGLWMDKGFKIDRNLKGTAVNLDACEIIYK